MSPRALGQADVDRDREVAEQLEFLATAVARNTEEKKAEARKLVARAYEPLRIEAPLHLRPIAVGKREAGATREELEALADGYERRRASIRLEHVHPDLPERGLPALFRKRNRDTPAKNTDLAARMQASHSPRAICDHLLRLVDEQALRRAHHEEHFEFAIPTTETLEERAREAGDTQLAGRFRKLRELMRHEVRSVGDYAHELAGRYERALDDEATLYLRSFREDLNAQGGTGVHGAVTVDLGEGSRTAIKERLGLPAHERGIDAIEE
jgi:hypothetical protein